jgi:hypothetical protein
MNFHEVDPDVLSYATQILGSTYMRLVQLIWSEMLMLMNIFH